MKKLLLAFALLGMISCKENNADGDHEDQMEDTASTSQKEIINDSSEKTETPSHKTIVNSRFNYSFSIPREWKAVDKSNNGDGFYISTGDANADVRIYGEELKGNEIAAEMELSTCDKTEKYIFRNGYPGTKCIQDNDEYYYYDTPDVRIVCFIHATSAWKKDNATEIDAMIKSISSGKENFN